MKRATAFLTSVEKKVFDFLVASVVQVEIEKNKPPVNRIGIPNGDLKKLFGIVSTDSAEVYGFLDVFFDKLERAGMIMKIGSRHDDKRIPILQVPIDLLKIRVVEVAKPQEDIMREPKAEITIERLQARVLELRHATQGGAEEVAALKREIDARLLAGDELDLNVVNRYNLLRKQPPKPAEELEELHQKLAAFELVITDLTGKATIAVQPAGVAEEKVHGKRTTIADEFSSEEKLVVAWFNHTKDPSEWVLAGAISGAVMKNGSFKTVAHVRSVLSSSVNHARRKFTSGEFKGLFESRELNKDERSKYDHRVQLLYRLSNAGEKFIQDYTDAKKA
jgi:hypothetical protein